MSLMLAKKGCKLVILDINAEAAQKVGTHFYVEVT